MMGDSSKLSRIAHQGRILAAMGMVVGLGWYIGQPIVNWWNQPAWARKFQEEQLRRGGNVNHPEFPTSDIIGEVKLPTAGQGIAGVFLEPLM